jgi:hypothetical protein
VSTGTTPAVVGHAKKGGGRGGNTALVAVEELSSDQRPVPEQTQSQIEQRPYFGNNAKQQTRPSPTQSTFSVDGALPGRRCAILAGSMHSPRLGRQLGRARTEQGRGGGDVRSGRLWEPTSTGRAWTTARRGTLGRRCCSARPVWSGARPIMTRRILGCGLAPTDPLHVLPGRRTGGLILKQPPAHSTRPAVHAVERRACRMESLPADALSLVAVSGHEADARRLVVCGQ